MDLNELLTEAKKIVSFKKLLPFFIILVVTGALFMFSKVMDLGMSNQNFFEVELNGIVNEIRHRPKDSYFQIRNKWYLIKDESIVYISIGDSISKPKSSYILRIYDKQSNIKWQGEIKDLIFKKVEMSNK